jgi:hypothetical protein
MKIHELAMRKVVSAVAEEEPKLKQLIHPLGISRQEIRRAIQRTLRWQRQ